MDACNLCGGSEWRVLETAGTIRVVRCRCGLVFVIPHPSRPMLEAAYNAAYYHPWEAQARLRERIWRERLIRVARLLSPPGRLLDVGCGTGSFLRAAKAHGWDVTGTELSRDGARMAQSDGDTVFTGDLWEAGFPDEGFDVITCWHVIEHVSDPRRLLIEMRRILSPGGLLVLATPNLHDFFFQLGYLLVRFRRPRIYEPDEREIHLFVYSVETLRQLAGIAGFADIHVGFDRGAAAVWGKRALDAVAYGWFRVTGLHWGMGLELTGRKGDEKQRRSRA